MHRVHDNRLHLARIAANCTDFFDGRDKSWDYRIPTQFLNSDRLELDVEAGSDGGRL